MEEAPQQVELEDFIKVSPGKNRMELSWKVADLDVASTTVFWTNKDSIEVLYDGVGDSMKVIIPDLEDANYSFKVYLYNKSGQLIKYSKVAARVYGNRYIESLKPLLIQSTEFNEENNTVEVVWGTPDKMAIGTDILYTDQSGTLNQVFTAYSIDTIALENYKAGTFFKYRTWYKPSPTAIDTFYTVYQTVPVISGRLRDIADAKNILFGTLISYGNPWLNSHGVIQDGSPNGIYTNLARSEFNVGQATWGGGGGWKGEFEYDFSSVNSVINWSLANNQKVMVHNILGPNNYMPDWFIQGDFSYNKMDELMKGLINGFMESNDNKSKVEIWDVVNEALNDEGGYRGMKWNDMGWEDDASGLSGSDIVNLKHPVFIGKALKYCREKTSAKLEIREYGIEINHTHAKYYKKQKAFYQLIKHLQAKGYPVDCIGIQAHRTIGIEQTGGIETFKSTISKFKQTGLEVLITELDIGTTVPWSSALAEQQMNDYYTTVKSAIEAGVSVISLWGIRDGNDPYWKTDENPLLYDKDYNEKPAYRGVRNALFDAKTE